MTSKSTSASAAGAPKCLTMPLALAAGGRLAFMLGERRAGRRASSTSAAGQHHVQAGHREDDLIVLVEGAVGGRDDAAVGFRTRALDRIDFDRAAQRVAGPQRD